MAKTPVVLIHSGASANLDDFYKSIQAKNDRLYHNYQPHFKPVTMTDKDHADQNAYGKYADHAADASAEQGEHGQTYKDSGIKW